MAGQSVPVTLLSGFLGAGKTTLLKHVLEHSGKRLGVVVNDVAAVNIDAKLVRNQTTVKVGTSVIDTMELQNGCACCNAGDELFDTISNLLSVCQAKGYVYDRIIVEASGVAEPQSIRDKFNEAAADGLPIMAEMHLDTLVTLVDSATFMRDYSSKANLAQRQDLGEGGGRRPVVDLLVEQIECADVVVLNKVDQISEKNVQALSNIVSSLNPLGAVMPAEYGKVPCEAVLGAHGKALVAHLNIEGQHRGAVAAAKAEQAPHSHKHEDVEGGEGVEGCKACEHEHHHKHAEGEEGHAHHDHDHAHAHNHNHKSKAATTAESRFGIRSFVYARRRPFHPQRLRQLVLRWLPVATNSAVPESERVPDEAAEPSPVRKVLRSKGFVWLSSGHATAHYWSHAGQHFEIRDEGDWWAVVPDEEWPQMVQQRKIILADFDTPEYGDRRQEIVFIGADMDEDAISNQLDGALLDDEEMVKYKEKWGAQADPPHPLDPMGADGL